VPVVAFAYAHIPLLGGLMFVAGGVSVLVRAEGDATPAGAWALCAGVAAFLAALNVAHAQLVAGPQREVLRARWVALAAILAIPFCARTPIAVAGATFVLLAALVTFEALTCGPEQAAVDRDAARADAPH
jgi:low temperature requirement protein LtrA